MLLNVSTRSSWTAVALWGPRCTVGILMSQRRVEAAISVKGQVLQGKQLCSTPIMHKVLFDLNKVEENTEEGN